MTLRLERLFCFCCETVQPDSSLRYEPRCPNCDEAKLAKVVIEELTAEHHLPGLVKE